MVEQSERSIHSLIYWAVCETCFDREYIYRAFVKHFGEISRQMFVQLPAPEAGKYVFNGIKSQKTVTVKWAFERRLNYCGSNHVNVTAQVLDRITGAEETAGGTFNVNTGRNIDDEAFM